MKHLLVNKEKEKSHKRCLALKKEKQLPNLVSYPYYEKSFDGVPRISPKPILKGLLIDGYRH